MIDEVEEFLTGSRPRAAGGAGRSARSSSPTSWIRRCGPSSSATPAGASCREAHEALCEREVKTFGGVVSDFTGDGVLASFDGLMRAVYWHCIARQARPGS